MLMEHLPRQRVLKKMIEEIIESEDPYNPLSDQEDIRQSQKSRNNNI